MLKHTLAVRGAQRQEHRVGYLVHGLDEWGDDDEQENGHEEGALQGAQVQHVCLHCDQQHGEPLRPPPHAVVVIGESFKALEVQLGQRQNGVGRVGDGHAESEEADGCRTALSDAGQQNDSPALLQDGVVLRVHVNVELWEEEHGPEEEELRGQQDGVPEGHEHREDSQQAKWGRHAVDPLLEHVDHVAQVVEHVEQANHQREDGGKVVQDVHDHHRQTGDTWKHRQCKHQEQELGPILDVDEVGDESGYDGLSHQVKNQPLTVLPILQQSCPEGAAIDVAPRSFPLHHFLRQEEGRQQKAATDYVHVQPY